MPSLIQRLRSFQRMGPAARRVGLVDALRFAERREITPLVNEHAANPSIEGYLILLARYYQIDAAARHKILEGGLKLSAALTRAARADDPTLRQTALQLIEIRGDTRCIPALTSFFKDENEIPENLARAAGLLRTFAQLLTKCVIPSHTEQLTMEQLDAAVAVGLDTYPAHRQPEVLLAAAILSREPGRALAEFLADDDHPAHFALRGVLKKFDDSFIAESALEWLNLDQLAPQLQDRLAQIARTPLLASILENVHLVHLPRVQARLQRLNARYPSSLPLGQAVQILDSRTQARLPLWLSTIPMTAPDRIATLGEGLCFKTPAARLAALRGLIKIHSPEADAMLESFCFDDNEAIARIAVQHCLRTHAGGHTDTTTTTTTTTRDLLARLAGSQHPSVRLMIARVNRIETFDDWWNMSIQILEQTRRSSDAPDAEENIASLRARQALGVRFLRTYRRPELAEALQDCLLSTDPDVRRHAVTLVRQFDLAELVELELLAIAAERDPQVTSEVIATLSTLRSEAAHDILWAALQHSDQRVRANAIESIQHRSDVASADWRVMLGERVISDDNRIRANAVRALREIDPTESERQLKMMLGDARPMHRISALWASARTGELACAEKVADLAATDEVAPVRERAQETAARLLGRLSAMRLAQNRVVAINPVEKMTSPFESKMTTKTTGTSASTTRSGRSAGQRVIATLTLFLTLSMAAALTFGQSQGNNQSNSDANDGGRLSKISDGFVGGGATGSESATTSTTGESGIGWAWVGWTIGALALISLVALTFKIQHQDHQRFGPDYREMAQDLKLNLFDTWLVNRMARAVGLTNGAGLLISEGTYQNHLTALLEKNQSARSSILKTMIRARNAHIRRHLFDS